MSPNDSRNRPWKEVSRDVILFEHTLTVTYPGIHDARLVQIAILTTVTLLGQFVFHFSITPFQIMLVVVTSVILDSWLIYRDTGKLVFPTSGFISSLSLALLIEITSPNPVYNAIYVLAGMLAIGSKHLITYQRRHIFNPSNFAIVVLLVFYHHIVAVNPDEWRTTFWLILPIALIGLRLIIKARVVWIALMFAATELLFFGLHWFMGDLSLFKESMMFNLSIFSPSLLIFTFFMITDPRTVPRHMWGKILFGAAVASLHWFYASFSMGPLALFLALFTCCLLVPLINIAIADAR